MILISLNLIAPATNAQPVPSNRVELNHRGVADSQVGTLQKDLTKAIIHGASVTSIQRLIDRRRQLDSHLSDQLVQTHRRLADFQRDGDPTGRADEIASLRRTRSLLWLNRIELAAMQSECFSAGSSEAVVAAHETIRLIEQASTELPSRPSDLKGRRRPGNLIAREINRLLIEAHLQGGDGWTAENVWSSRPSGETPSRTPEDLSMTVRISLANRRYDEAEAALQGFYGTDPVEAPKAITMDFAMLEFLWSSPKRSEAELGDWIDTIETRGGPLARRRAETWIARKRQLTESPSSSQSDPRLLRADGRYYYRTEEPLQAAIAFAKASVQDDQADRAIESAVSSAAILKKLSEPDAGKELLLQVADRFSRQAQSADLVLQAASLASQSDAVDIDEIKRILQRCLQTWPRSVASRSARDWLIAILVDAKNELKAAKLATSLPAEHWNESARERSRILWSKAVLAADDPDAVLLAMRRTFDEVMGSEGDSDAGPLRRELFALLDDSIPDPSRIHDPVYQRLAEFRTTPNGSPHPELWHSFERDPDLEAAVQWRLQRDIEQRPETASAIALALLKHDGGSELDRLRWLIQSGQTDRATDYMRSQMAGSANPVQWLRVMASTLATTPRSDSRRRDHLRLASRIWTELSDGLPQDDPAGIAAQIEAIRCQFQSGDQAAAIARAELMLLTRPPSAPAQLNWLKSLR